MSIIKVIHLEKPNKNSVEEYIEKWNKLENYVIQEKALDKLFFELCPSNKRIEDILIKCSTLNDFYSTKDAGGSSLMKQSNILYGLNDEKRISLFF